jgi:hypothetical protein
MSDNFGNDDGNGGEGSRKDKNAIFSAPEDVEKNWAMSKGLAMSREEIVKRDFGLDIPTALVPLPSGGAIYPSDSPLHMKEHVEIRGMTTREEDILMSRALIRKGTVISELIKSCIVTPGVDVQGLVGGDRNALMVSIRILGYGSEYQGSIDCPKCEHKNEISVNLNDLNIKPLKVQPVEAGVNKFAFTLPLTKKEVLFKFLTGREEEEILAALEMKKKKGVQNDNVVTTRLLHSVVSIGGISDKHKISQFISFMPARDSIALRQYMDDVEPGMDMKFDFTCGSCGHWEVMPLPLGPNFFWPNARKS